MWTVAQNLIVDIWGFIAGGLLDIMGLDFACLQSHIVSSSCSRCWGWSLRSPSGMSFWLCCLAFAMGGSKNTASIFTGWCRMFGSMCLLMVTNLVCFKMLFSVVPTVPSGLDILP